MKIFQQTFLLNLERRENSAIGANERIRRAKNPCRSEYFMKNRIMNEYSFTINQIVKCQEKLKKVAIQKRLDIK
jgi:hypothetical protein